MRHVTTFLCLIISLVIPIAASDYHEQLVLKPLPLSALLASFNFRSNTTRSQFEAHNFRFFPRSLAQILEYSGTKELHLRFSLGRWDAESWGVRPWGGTREGGTGVELWAWLDADTEEEYGEIRSRNSEQDQQLTRRPQSRQQVVNPHECLVWLVLRLTKLHRLNADNPAGYVIPARRRPL
jgi:hypothetical protein